MTFNEFKSWLDGFSEAIGEAPTPEQWAKVNEKLATVQEWVFPVNPNLGLPALPSYPSPYPRYFDTDYPPVPPYTVTCGISNTGGVN